MKLGAKDVAVDGVAEIQIGCKDGFSDGFELWPAAGFADGVFELTVEGSTDVD